MNLGSLIGRLLMQAGDDLELPAEPTCPKAKSVVILKEGGVRAKIREAMRGRSDFEDAASIAKRTGLTALQVQTNVPGMRDVERCSVVSADGIRKPFRYRLRTREAS